MQLTLSVDMGEGPFEVSTTLYCWLLWERKTKQKVANLQDGIGFDDLAYLAYEACKIHKIVVPAVYDDFCRKIVALELVDGETEHPTEAAPTGDN
jgi:hypothetical protein